MTWFDERYLIKKIYEHVKTVKIPYAPKSYWVKNYSTGDEFYPRRSWRNEVDANAGEGIERVRPIRAAILALKRDLVFKTEF